MRIRTIKPEFFKHDGVAALPALHRILLVGIWCCADGWGRLEDRPARLKVEVLPYDDIDIEPMLSDLSRAGFIVRYEVSGQRLIEVPNFRTHQNIQGREFAISSKYPSINDGSIFHSAGSDAEVPTHSRGSDGMERKGKDTEGSAEGCELSSPTGNLPLGDIPNSPGAPSAPPTKREPKLSDADWLAMLHASEAYRGINIDAEIAKCRNWCASQPTPQIVSRRRIVNWLNRVERPLASSQARQISTQAHFNEPTAWKVWINHNAPSSAYAEGQEHSSKKWHELDRSVQGWITGEMKKAGGLRYAS